MAIITATAFKAAIATAAADLTTAWTDAVVTRTAATIRDPKHALRQIEKLFNFNAATGVVTADDGYIDAAYAGEPLNKPNPFDKRTDIEPLALVTATVEDADTTEITLTFDSDIGDITGLSIGGTVTTAKTIVAFVAVKNIVLIEASTPYINTDTITVTGVFQSAVDFRSPLVLSAEAVTNNVS